MKNKTNVCEGQNVRWICSFFCLFRIYEKKHFTENPLLTQKLLHQRESCWSRHFWVKSGFSVKCFFSYIRNKQKNEQVHLTFCSSPTFVLFFTKTNYIHEAEGRGLLSWKIVNKWTMARFSFCRYIFPEEWSKKNNVFFRSAMEGLWNVIFMFLLKT